MLQIPKLSDRKTNVSSSFLHRARCKYCKSCPLKAVGLFFNSSRYVDMEPSIEYKRSMSSHPFYKIDYYIKYSMVPKNMTGNWISYIFYLGLKTGNARYNKNLKDPSFIDCLSCKCGKTKWYYSTSSAVNRPEVVNRKARY